MISKTLLLAALATLSTSVLAQGQVPAGVPQPQPLTAEQLAEIKRMEATFTPAMLPQTVARFIAGLHANNNCGTITAAQISQYQQGIFTAAKGLGMSEQDFRNTYEQSYTAAQAQWASASAEQRRLHCDQAKMAFSIMFR